MLERRYYMNSVANILEHQPPSSKESKSLVFPNCKKNVPALPKTVPLPTFVLSTERCLSEEYELPKWRQASSL